jgi:hypothetical protein
VAQSLSLATITTDIADALQSVDRSKRAHKQFAPGIGPHGEAEAVRAALSELQTVKPDTYGRAVIKRVPDLLVPGQWAIEFKIARPFGDNGRPAEHWSENLLHPYPGNTSSLGDCLKLIASGLSERKAVVIIGYEHSPPIVSLDPAIRSFERLARDVMSIHLDTRIEVLRDKLIHPIHQQLRVIAYEVLGPLASGTTDGKLA